MADRAAGTGTLKGHSEHSIDFEMQVESGGDNEGPEAVSSRAYAIIVASCGG
jgi:hypothetical protein